MEAFSSLNFVTLAITFFYVFVEFRVERDAQLLANRIALLKQEEMKTWKKIEETKKKAAEVMRLKQKNEERIRSKVEKMQYDNMRA